MKNIHTRLFLLIVILLAGAVYTLATKPTREGLDIKGGMRVVLQAQTNKLKKGTWDTEKLNMVAGIMRNRVDALGVAEPVVYPKPPDQIVVELPGLTNRQQALDVIQSTAKLEFRYVPEFDDGTWITDEEKRNDEPTGFEQISGRDGKPIPQDQLNAQLFDNPDRPPILTGAELKPNARADIGTGSPVIHFEFKDDAKETFENFTRGHVGKRLAIFLDNRLISAPKINGVIPGEGIIEGNFTAEAAKTLADQLNAGALPVPLTQLQVVNVEATLGKQAVHQTLIAGILGLALVVLVMLWWYRVPGLLADIALVLYGIFTFAIFKLVPVTLTVPGIAGFILSIGMAVDANILIFERMKEERLAGKSLRAAIEAGFKRAFTAIFDSNVCTLITCGILYNFGTGQVRGFALTLAIGVIVSMFTAITCTRTFLLMLAGSSFGQNDDLYALHSGVHPRLGVTKRMKMWFALSGLVIIPGLIAWFAGGIKKNIEFTGGTEIAIKFQQKPSAAAINQALVSVGHKEARVLLAEDNRAIITTHEIRNPQQQAEVTQAIESKVGPIANETVTGPQGPVTQKIINFSNASPAMSKELTANAIMAVVYASVLIIVYLGLRFAIGGFVEGLKFGVCAVIALLHDVAVVWGFFAIMGFIANWQIDSLFVTAMLTVIGFSVHDTIVIFDRIRENLHHKARGETFADVTDRSIEQTFTRSVRTSATVAITLAALLIMGGPATRYFVAALLLGVISGTYSSIFNASPLLVWIKRLTGTDLVTAPAAGPAPRPTAVRQPQPPARPRPLPQTPAPAPNVSNVDAEDAVSAGAAGDRVKPKKRKRRM